jgi:hypothetical protein
VACMKLLSQYNLGGGGGTEGSHKKTSVGTVGL